MSDNMDALIARDGFQVHVLKTHPEPFAAVRARIKGFEYRWDDRGFNVGDTLWLEEFDPATGKRSGENEVRSVTYILRDCFGIPPGYALMSVTDDPALLRAVQAQAPTPAVKDQA